MSITIKIYQYDGDHRVLDKQLPAGIELTGTFREYIDIMKPSVLVERSAVTGNYVHIGSPINRYYYIDEITQDRTGLQVLHLREDVLMTHRDQIMQQPCVIRRNGAWSNTDLYDPDLQTLQRTQSYMSPLGSAFSYASRYIFVTVG